MCVKLNQIYDPEISLRDIRISHAADLRTQFDQMDTNTTEKPSSSWLSGKRFAQPVLYYFLRVFVNDGRELLSVLY